MQRINILLQDIFAKKVINSFTSSKSPTCSLTKYNIVYLIIMDQYPLLYS